MKQAFGRRVAEGVVLVAGHEFSELAVGLVLQGLHVDALRLDGPSSVPVPTCGAHDLTNLPSFVHNPGALCMYSVRAPDPGVARSMRRACMHACIRMFCSGFFVDKDRPP